jgi:Serine aminopeptidase, S33
VTKERIEFMSGQVPCAGYLILPDPETDAHERLPSIILAHGFSGTMDWLIPHAERFASAGFAAVIFDYRGFGESQVEPRQVVDVSGQHQDIRAAVAWVRGREDSSSWRTRSSGLGLREAQRLADHLQEFEGDARLITQFAEGRTREPAEPVEHARIQEGEGDGSITDGRGHPRKRHAGPLQALDPPRPAGVARRECVPRAGPQDPDLDQPVDVLRGHPGLLGRLLERVPAHDKAIVASGRNSQMVTVSAGRTLNPPLAAGG